MADQDFHVGAIVFEGEEDEIEAETTEKVGNSKGILNQIYSNKVILRNLILMLCIWSFTTFSGKLQESQLKYTKGNIF